MAAHVYTDSIKPSVSVVALLAILFSFTSLGLIGCSDDDAPPPRAKKEIPAEQLSSKKANQAPVLKPIGDQLVKGGSSLQFVVGAKDTPDDILFYSAATLSKDVEGNEIEEPLPEGAVLEIHPEYAGIRLFTWTPTNSQAGAYRLRFTVEDDGVEPASDSEDIAVTVYASNDPVFDPLSPPIQVEVTPNPKGPAHVNLDAKVMDAAGKLIPGQMRFELTEGGVAPHTPESDVTVFPNMYDHYTLLMLDFSGSLSGQQDVVDQKIAASRDLITTLIPRGEKVAICFFQRNIVTLQNFTDNQSELLDKLDELTDHIEHGSSTNLYGGFIYGLNKLDNSATGTGVEGVKAGSMVLFTDGHDLTSTYTLADVQTAVSGTSHDIYVIGADTIPEGETDILDRGTLSGLVGGENYVEAVGYTDEADPRPTIKAAFSKVADMITAKLDQETGKHFMVTFCSGKNDLNVSREVRVVVTDPLNRSNSDSYTYASAGNFRDTCFTDMDEMKLQAFDFDGDEYYSVQGELNDCDDFKNWLWNSCDTCEDADGDGYPGTGECDTTHISLWDCNDDPNDPYAAVINPNRTDTEGDEIDADCDFRDGTLTQ